MALAQEALEALALEALGLPHQTLLAFLGVRPYVRLSERYIWSVGLSSRYHLPFLHFHWLYGDLQERIYPVRWQDKTRVVLFRAGITNPHFHDVKVAFAFDRDALTRLRVF